VWVVLLAFLVRGAGWARGVCRVLSALTVLAIIASFVFTPGRRWLYAMLGIQALVFSLAVHYLRYSTITKRLTAKQRAASSTGRPTFRACIFASTRAYAADRRHVSLTRVRALR
jgi:hypothetical protein